MGFVRDMAKVGTFGLAGLALSKNKKKDPLARQPSMINSAVTPQPMSMIGSPRG